MTLTVPSYDTLWVIHSVTVTPTPAERGAGAFSVTRLVRTAIATVGVVFYYHAPSVGEALVRRSTPKVPVAQV